MTPVFVGAPPRATPYNIPDSSSSACSINSSLTSRMRRGMRKIMVDAQAADNTTMARLSATGVAKWPPRYAPNCENSEPIPICKNPIVPDAVPAASARTLMAPAAGEGEDDLRGQHLAQHIADEGAAGDETADIAAKSAGFDSGAARLGQRESDGDRDHKGGRGNNVEDRAPAERGLDQAAGQRAQHLRDHHHCDDQADHSADALAAVEIADDDAAHHNAGGASQRLQKARRDQLRQGLGENAGRPRHDHQA